MTANQYDIPNISVDVVPVLYKAETNEVGVVLGKRLYAPNLGDYALPGVLLNGPERLTEAAHRALLTKTRIAAEDVTAVNDLGTFDNPDRDPRGATVSIAKIAVLSAFEDDNDDSRRFVPLSEAVDLELPFDHTNIIRFTVSAMEERFMKNRDFTKALLGKTFSTGAVKEIATQLHEASKSDDIPLDFGNIGRLLKNSGWVKPSNATQAPSTGRGRPSVLWEWID